jgi:oligoendopeptidase F
MKTTKKPTLTEIKTEWDFSYMYTGITDPKVEKDIHTYVKLFKAFAAKYKDKKFLKNGSTLQKALSDWNVLQEKTSPVALWYLMLKKRLDETDKDLQAILNRLTDIYMKGTKEIVFFASSISKLDPKKQAVFLKDKKLVPYKYLLQTLFK